ncbi:MAG: GAF domain-containing protein [Thermoanaerobaculia bacterium]|nr:GAF domain-containing protein [Thermoanaerobaculia bacterium]
MSEPGAAGAADPEALLAEIERSLDTASRLLREMKGRVPPAGETSEDGRPLRERLEAAERDLGELTERLVDTENQRGRLMNLYVATYQLHATLDMEEVKATIGEISRELLGAERFVLLLREEEGSRCEIALAEGFEEGSGGRYEGGRYEGGDPAVDQTLEDGQMRMGGAEGSEALAVVPLRVQGAVVGAVVLLKLFDHKPTLTANDRDLLDLLAAHAASALLAARVYSNTDRKLRTLQSLVQLVRSD